MRLSRLDVVVTEATSRNGIGRREERGQQGPKLMDVVGGYSTISYVTSAQGVLMLCRVSRSQHMIPRTPVCIRSCQGYLMSQNFQRVTISERQSLITEEPTFSGEMADEYGGRKCQKAGGRALKQSRESARRSSRDNKVGE
jgi:hypothetical protein